MNNVVLVGNLARDPDMRYSSGPEPLSIAKFTVACNRRFKKEGQPDVDFISCTAFGKTADIVGKYFRKGSKIGLNGRIQVSEYTSANGERRWSTDVICDNVEFVESRATAEARGVATGPPSSGGYAAPPSEGYTPPREVPPEGFEMVNAEALLEDEDLPF